MCKNEPPIRLKGRYDPNHKDFPSCLFSEESVGAFPLWDPQLFLLVSISEASPPGCTSGHIRSLHVR